MNTPKLWTKDFIAVSLVGLFVSLSFNLLLVIMSVYAMDTFQSSPSLAGLAASILLIGAIIARIIFGRWIERIGRRKMLLAALILNLVVAILYFVANNYILLLFVRLLHGAAFGIVLSVGTTIAASIIPEGKRGEGLAYFISLSGTISMAMGPFLGLLILQHGSYNMIFIFCSIFAILSLVIAFILSVPEVKLTEQQIKETSEFKFNRFFSIKVIPISIICGIIFFSFSSIMTFISAYSIEINLLETASLFFIILSATMIVIRLFVGRLLDLKGENIVMYPAILIFILGIFTISQVHNGVTLIIAAVLVGIGQGTISSSGNTIAIKMVPPHHIGLATSTFLNFMDAGMGIGPFILGLFIPLYGYRGMYIGAAIVAVIGLFLYYLLHGKGARIAKVKDIQNT